MEEFDKLRKREINKRYRAKHLERRKFKQNLWARLKRKKVGLIYNKPTIKVRCDCGQLIDAPLHDGLQILYLRELTDIHTLH